MDYRELLETFERSEKIRHEQKELIQDQRLQVRALKTKAKQQEQQMTEMRNKQRYLEVMLETAQLQLRQAGFLPKPMADPDCSTTYSHFSHTSKPKFESAKQRRSTSSKLRHRSASQ